jgi:hypothetical protein
MAESCIIWPPGKKDDQSRAGRCFIHNFEQRRLNIGGEFTVRAQVLNGHLSVVEWKSELTPDNLMGAFFSIFSGRPHFRMVRKRGQNVDMGGYYLDPQEITDG